MRREREPHSPPNGRFFPSFTNKSTFSILTRFFRRQIAFLSLQTFAYSQPQDLSSSYFVPADVRLSPCCWSHGKNAGRLESYLQVHLIDTCSPRARLRGGREVGKLVVSTREQRRRVNAAASDEDGWRTAKRGVSPSIIARSYELQLLLRPFLLTPRPPRMVLWILQNVEGTSRRAMECSSVAEHTCSR